MSRTSIALNNLRSFAILMVLAFHSFIAYMATPAVSPQPFNNPPYSWTANPIVDSARWLGFDLFCAFQYLYLMQFMFFLSGLFIWPSLVRKGGKKFLYERFLRLGVPFLLGVYLLMPVAYYPVYRVTALDPSWAAFSSHWMALPFWPSGPMWFLWCLLFLNIVAVGFYWLAPGIIDLLGRLAAKAGGRPSRFFVALVGICAIAYVPLAAVFKPWQWLELGPFSFQPSFAAQYVIYFFAGVGVGAYGLERGLLAADGMLRRRWALWLASAPVGFAIWIIPSALIVKGVGAALPGLQLIADLGFVLSSATACFGLSAAFLQFASVRWPISESLSRDAYGIYLIHYVFVIWLQYLLLDVPLLAVTKAVIVFCGTLILSWAVTAAICRIPIGARLIRVERRASASTP